ncbi:uncharacterized protein TRAVEDRAFT_155352 [Trametes versicolor FP-101664 SS1]|uniref:uncharacterized protein n=1 Tax=Trametes versicolor (strain FP-101664) TaxID=717944 RepID=UPI0004622510|nr:uncharacterized protein TRAVEDRAFT_155352 [Trametes versicolor FP-101664 SS1]EIW52586.1 hypothetical protein TRAVEDRAFT_155352 [Trametes versicolor FP-101664 SS1]
MADPVAEKSGFLCMYMSNHPDTLVSYVRHWGKVTEHVVSAKMTGIDTKGMNLSYQTKGGATKEVRVVFDPPLAGYEEVKPRLMGMKADAEEELGMVPAPQITSFRFSRNMAYMAAMVAALIYTTFAPAPGSPNYSPLYAPAHILLANLPSWVLTFSWTILVVTHSLESLYTLALCRKHRTGFVLGAQYILTTLAVGFPAWVEMRRQIQEARIESIMKGQ